MKAVRIHETGGPEVLKFEDCPDPVPGPGQALVELQAIGVNFTDIYTRSGMTPSPLPVIPGLEGAGVVRAVGSGVKEVKSGDQVAYTGVMGSYAQKVVAPSWRLVKVPKGVSAETAAAVMLQGMTAHYLATATYPLKNGDRCLIHAGAGGVGLLLIQIAKRRGAYVFATVSTEAKAREAKQAGADQVINYSRQDFEAEIKKATDGKGLQAVYDSVGKTTFDKSLACLAPRGYLVLYGQSSGFVSPVDPRVLNRGSLFLTRPTLVDYTATRQELIRRSGDLFKWLLSDELKVKIFESYPLWQAENAHKALQNRETVGKLLLIP